MLVYMYLMHGTEGRAGVHVYLCMVQHSQQYVPDMQKELIVPSPLHWWQYGHDDGSSRMYVSTTRESMIEGRRRCWPSLGVARMLGKRVWFR